MIQPHLRILQQQFVRRQKANPRYSLRAFSRDLKVSPAFLNNIMKGKRGLSLKRAEKIADTLQLDPRSKRKFFRSALLKTAQEQTLMNDDNLTLDYQTLQLDQFQFFNHWYYVALLDLIACRGFKSDPIWIGKRLGIDPAVARTTLESLLRLGLVQSVDADQWRKCRAEFSSADD